jgi:spore coat polysaccharide biosynthesis predicted glycosyltransferase SpsG
MKTRFLFRLAAGPRIGFGHLMRCRALARALRVRPIVSIRGGAAARLTAQALGCEVVRDGTRTLRAVDLLVVDDPAPARARAWLRRARRAGTPVATIHDLGVGSRAADLIVDGSITGHAPRGAAPVLYGTRFTVLDPRVTAARTDRRRRVGRRKRLRVLVALGGGAHVYALARTLVDAIHRRCRSAAIDVVAGFCRRDVRPSLGAARWIERRDGLAPDLAGCDVAVVAGGVTLYEACAIGVPAVAMAVVPGQQRAIRAFAARGAVVDIGSLAGADGAVELVAAAVAELLRDASARDRRASAARRLVDGRGAQRVALRIRVLARNRASRRSRRV